MSVLPLLPLQTFQKQYCWFCFQGFQVMDGPILQAHQQQLHQLQTQIEAITAVQHQLAAAGCGYVGVKHCSLAAVSAVYYII